MTICSLELTKIWEDEHFFEINMIARSPHCHVDINFYTSNDELKKLQNGIETISHFIEKEFIWTNGADKENITHYVYFRFFPCSHRGHIAIEILIDNKLLFIQRIKSNFYITTELGSLDDFTSQLNKLINGKENMIKGIIYSQL